MKTFRNGLTTGLILQIAIGPVFFYIANLTLQRTLFDGLVGALAVSLGDFFYIALSILGVGKILEKPKVKKLFGFISSLVLIIFGLMIIKTALGSPIVSTVTITSSNLFTSFISVFLLTLSNPLTIVLFTSVFTAKALEHNYNKNELVVFGLGTASATLLFMGASAVVFSLIRGVIPVALVQILNLVVGGLLIVYGAWRLAKNGTKWA